MPKIEKPKKKVNPKGEPPSSVSTDASPILMRKPHDKVVPLNFTVQGDFKRDFKTFAAQNDIPMVDLLKLSFEAYKQQTQI